MSSTEIDRPVGFSVFPRNLAPDFGQYVCEPSRVASPKAKRGNQMNNSNIDFRNSIGRSPVCFGCLLIALVLAFVILSSNARAQDGNYGNGNTAEGADALYTIISGNAGGPPGGGNTAIGFNALFSDTFGTENTAVGDGAV